MDLVVSELENSSKLMRGVARVFDLVAVHCGLPVGSDPVVGLAMPPSLFLGRDVEDLHVVLAHIGIVVGMSVVIVTVVENTSAIQPLSNLVLMEVGWFMCMMMTHPHEGLKHFLVGEVHLVVASHKVIFRNKGRMMVVEAVGSTHCRAQESLDSKFH